MILFIGDKEIYDFISSITPDVTYDIGIEAAEKLIVCDSSDQAVSAVKAATLINLPVLGILGGHNAVASACRLRCETCESCSEGKQEIAILDTSSPIFFGLETVIKICRGNPTALIPAALTGGFDCCARAETGEIIAFASEEAGIYAVNFHISSGLTPDGKKIIKNFIYNI